MAACPKELSAQFFDDLSAFVRSEVQKTLRSNLSANTERFVQNKAVILQRRFPSKKQC